MTWDLITNIVFGVVGFLALFVQQHEIRKLKRDLRHSQRDAAHAHNTLAFWQDLSDKWKQKFEETNALCFELDHYKNDYKVEQTKRLAAEAALKEKSK